MCACGVWPFRGRGGVSVLGCSPIRQRMTGAAQGDGTNEHGKHGRTIFQEEIALPCLVDIISEDDIGMKTLSQSEKYRFVTCLGRVKETTSNLRKLHARLKPTYTKIMESADFVFALTGDLKYLLTMNGNLGASSTCPCPVCVRKRRNLVTLRALTTPLSLLYSLGPTRICRIGTEGDEAGQGSIPPNSGRGRNQDQNAAARVSCRPEL